MLKRRSTGMAPPSPTPSVSTAAGSIAALRRSDAYFWDELETDDGIAESPTPSMLDAPASPVALEDNDAARPEAALAPEANAKLQDTMLEGRETELNPKQIRTRSPSPIATSAPSSTTPSAHGDADEGTADAASAKPTVFNLSSFGAQNPELDAKAKQALTLDLKSMDKGNRDAMMKSQIQMEKGSDKQHDDDGEQPDPVEVELLKKGASDGVEARSTLGWRFSRELGNNANYKAASSKERALWRKRWAESKLTLYESKFTKTTTKEKVDISQGRYRSTIWLWREEGGAHDPIGALERVNAWTKKQAAKGHPFVAWDEEWERMEYLFFEKGVNESFGTKWDSTDKYKPSEPKDTSPAAVAVAGTAQETVDNGKVESKGGKVGVESKGGKRNVKAGGAPADSPNTAKKAEKKAKPPNASQWMSQVQKSFATACSGADHLLACMDSDPAWSWANEHNTQDLRHALKAVRDLAAESPFLRSALSVSVAETKKMHPDDFEKKAGVMCETMTKPIEELTTQTNSLIAMHRARLAAAVATK